MKTEKTTLLFRPQFSHNIFILISAFIHLGLITGLPSSCHKAATPAPKFFQVDLIKLPRPVNNEPDHTVKNIRRKTKHENNTFETSQANPAKPLVNTAPRETTISLNTKDLKYTNYLAHLKDRINRNWSYPESARQNQIEGELTLTFTINHTGNITDVRIDSSSKNQLLDTAAVNAVYHAGPFHPLPETFNLIRLNIVSTFIYRCAAD